MPDTKKINFIINELTKQKDRHSRRASGYFIGFIIAFILLLLCLWSVEATGQDLNLNLNPQLQIGDNRSLRTNKIQTLMDSFLINFRVDLDSRLSIIERKVGGLDCTLQFDDLKKQTSDISAKLSQQEQEIKDIKDVQNKLMTEVIKEINKGWASVTTAMSEKHDTIINNVTSNVIVGGTSGSGNEGEVPPRAPWPFHWGRLLCAIALCFLSMLLLYLYRYNKKNLLFYRDRITGLKIFDELFPDDKKEEVFQTIDLSKAFAITSTGHIDFNLPKSPKDDLISLMKTETEKCCCCCCKKCKDQSDLQME